MIHRLFSLPTFLCVAVVAAIVAVALPIFKWSTGTRFQGHDLVVQQVVDLGDDIAGGSPVETSVLIQNVGSSSRKLLGIRQSCGCISTESFPLTIDAGKARHLEVKIDTPQGQASFQYDLVLYTDTPGRTAFPVEIRGSCR